MEGCVKKGKIDTAVNCHKLIPGRDVKAQMIFLLLLGQRNDAMRDPCRYSFKCHIQLRLQGTEIPPEDMAVGGVDDDGDAAQPGRPAPQNARLGGMGVDDLRFLNPKDA